jgi:hypothetical protein
MKCRNVAGGQAVESVPIFDKLGCCSTGSWGDTSEWVGKQKFVVEGVIGELDWKGIKH